MDDAPRDDWPAHERDLEAGIDFDRANAARMYDYALGGGHNFAVDREAVGRVAASYPGVYAVARANRAFLGEVVRWCLDRGIDQFLDLGSGVPTVGNVHDIAHATAPGARVAYVDFEPVAVAHAQALLADQPRVTITRADIRDPASVLEASGVAGLLDFARPVALLAITVLHFVVGDAAGLLAQYRRVLSPGSLVAVSHASDDQDDAELAGRVREGAVPYADSATPITLRSRVEILDMFRGLELVEPGLVDVRDWPTPHRDWAGAGCYGALGLVR